MVSQRDAWAQELLELCRADEDILVLDGDLATSTKSVLIARELPDQFFQMGIAEQNMVAVAAGLASTGHVPWVSTFGVFLTQRSLDQIRMLVSQTEANVKFAGHYTGILNGRAGKTHQDIQDLAILRTMPGVTVICPADGEETARAVRWATDHEGPVYLRLARDDAGPLHDSGSVPQKNLRPDSLVLVQDGDPHTVVISTGIQSVRTREAVEQLAEADQRVRHFHAPFLKPLRPETILNAVGDASLVITVEEHSVLGGLGGLVAESLTRVGHRAQVHRLGLADAWSESAPDGFLLDAYGLSANKVSEQIRGLGVGS